MQSSSAETVTGLAVAATGQGEAPGCSRARALQRLHDQRIEGRSNVSRLTIRHGLPCTISPTEGPLMPRFRLLALLAVALLTTGCLSLDGQFAVDADDLVSG